MALDSVGAADDQNGIVQHPHGPLRLAGEVHVARRIQKGDGGLPQRQDGLLGKDGDAPLPLDGVGVQKSVLVVHPAQTTERPTPVEQAFRQGSFARVHMGQNTDGQFFHKHFFLFVCQFPRQSTGRGRRCRCSVPAAPIQLLLVYHAPVTESTRRPFPRLQRRLQLLQRLLFDAGYIGA